MLIVMMSELKLSRGIFTATVQQNIPLCDEHYRLVLKIEGFPSSVPGQFVELHTLVDSVPSVYTSFDWYPDGHPPQPQSGEFVSAAPFLRRPYSIAHHEMKDGASVIHIIYRVIGKMTRKMEALHANDQISLIGPLGHGFNISKETNRVILAGGGVGIPPMLYLGARLAERHISAMALIGVQKKQLLPLRIIHAGPSHLPNPLMCVEEFAQFGIPAVITTDDGSLGVHGQITTALDAVLSLFGGPDVAVCCCGPNRMMQATANVSQAHGVVCFASLEQPMACGMGTCQSCVIKYQPPHSTEWAYKLTCTDGPVFNTRDIIWN